MAPPSPAYNGRHPRRGAAAGEAVCGRFVPQPERRLGSSPADARSTDASHATFNAAAPNEMFALITLFGERGFRSPPCSPLSTIFAPSRGSVSAPSLTSFFFVSLHVSRRGVEHSGADCRRGRLLVEGAQ